MKIWEETNFVERAEKEDRDGRGGRGTGTSGSYATIASAMVNDRGRVGGVGSLPMPSMTDGYNKEKRDFFSARNSLQFWPIEGKNEAEMLECFQDFLQNALGMSGKEKDSILKIRRVHSAPRGKAYKEVCVEFVDSNIRDEILMRGPMLASFRDDEGKPTAGIRLRIPGHLMGAFKALEAFGHRLKRNYGENFKKHIKFEEYDCTLYIQVGIKREGEAMEWTSYTADQARESNKKADDKKRGPKIDFLSSVSPKQRRGDDATGVGQAAGTTTSSGGSGTGPSDRGGERRRTFKPKKNQMWRPTARDSKSTSDSDSEMK